MEFVLWRKAGTSASAYIVEKWQNWVYILWLWTYLTTHVHTQNKNYLDFALYYGIMQYASFHNK